MLKIQYIACTNDAAFVMNFSIRYLKSDGKWYTTEWNSGNYSVGNTRKSPDLASIGVPADALAVTPYVHAVLGTSVEGSPFVLSDGNGQTGTYAVKGTTASFAVQMI